MRIIQSTRLWSAHDIKILIFCNLLNADFSNIFVAEETELHRFHALRRYLQITNALKSFVNYNFKLIINKLSISKHTHTAERERDTSVLSAMIE